LEILEISEVRFIAAKTGVRHFTVLRDNLFAQGQRPADHIPSSQNRFPPKMASDGESFEKAVPRGNQ